MAEGKPDTSLAAECACIATSGVYVCNLDKVTLETAQGELNERPSDRAGALQSFRHWLSEQRHIKSRTDDYYLLRILRGAKFSQLRARAMLEDYLRIKTDMRGTLGEISTRDNKIIEILNTGIIVPLPGNSNDLSQILLIRPDLQIINLSKYQAELYIKCLIIGGFYLGRQEMVQIHGIRIILDLSRIRKKDVVGDYLNLLHNLQVLQSNLQGCIPCRIKSIHIYCGNNYIKKTFRLVVEFLSHISQKMNKRVYCHGNLCDMYKYIPSRMLPPEYLPHEYKGPMAPPLQTIIGDFVSAVTTEDFWKLLWWDTSSRFRVDLYKMTAAGHQGRKEGSSYRKLNLD